MKKKKNEISWTQANQAFLAVEFARLKRLLGAKAEGNRDRTIEKSREAMEIPPAIDQLSELFGLSAFEREILLLCAGVEMDSKLAAQCAEAKGQAHRTYATFGLCLSVLSGPHWSALAPSAPIRRFRLVEVEPGQGLASAPLRIDERILHYLAGVNTLDSRLQLLLQPCAFPDWIAAEHQMTAEQWIPILENRNHRLPLLQLCGDDFQGQEDAAAFACLETGRQLFVLRTEDLPAPGPELNQVLILWQRETALLGGALLIQTAQGAFTPAARHLAERLPGTVFLSGREPVRLTRAFLRFDINKPLPSGQRRLWERALGPEAGKLKGVLDGLSEQFRLSARTVFSTVALAEKSPTRFKDLWNACRTLARPRLDDLAQRITPSAGWDDLVLPEAQKETLRQLVSQVRHRMKVYETWGFSDKGRRGLGVNALFSGESGTGKTMAAEVLALELGLDLYRVDLSAVVSKYIGETEKNLRQVFDVAEEGGVILLFDEADALFGKRGDVKDSHDRYANIEVGYLLQRIEAYEGLAILTTNLKSSMDKAFQRRLRFTVTFPFPDAVQREAIWSRVFPSKTETRGLEPEKLALMNVAGGSIRNIALNAAFFAVEAGRPVGMEHLLKSAQLEAQKIERPLSAAEVQGWV